MPQTNNSEFHILLLVYPLQSLIGLQLAVSYSAKQTTARTWVWGL